MREHEAFLRSKAIGMPQATEAYTVEELLAMDMVGVYVIDERHY